MQFTFSTWWRCIIIPEDSTIWALAFIFTQIKIIRWTWDTPPVMSYGSCGISWAKLTLITWKREFIFACANRNIYIQVQNSEYWSCWNTCIWIFMQGPPNFQQNIRQTDIFNQNGHSAQFRFQTKVYLTWLLIILGCILKWPSDKNRLKSGIFVFTGDILKLAYEMRKLFLGWNGVCDIPSVIWTVYGISHARSKFAC